MAAVPAVAAAVVWASMRLLSRPGAVFDRGIRPALGGLAVALLLLGCLLFSIAREDPGSGLQALIGAEVVATGALLLIGAAARWRRRQSLSLPAWVLPVAVVAASGMGVGVALTSQYVIEPDLTVAPFFDTPVKFKAGFGPERRALFRCDQPWSCEGPHYVSFNAYINNPKIRDERRFLAVSNPYDAGGTVVDALSLDGKARELTLRVFIDNNTYQRLPGRSTDALDTRLRVALPTAPTYETKPTAYLYARNARPKIVWDTVSLYSLLRPVRLEYVRGSTRLRRRGESKALPDGITSPSGLRLGRWKADFVNDGYVTFKVRTRPEPEPIRNPQLTRAIGGPVVYPPPADKGLAAEPLAHRESLMGDRFFCARTHCKGPPFPELDAYANHPLLGDESDFVRGALTNYQNEGIKRYRMVAVVRPGDDLDVRIAIDNGGDPSAVSALPLEQLVARNTWARVLLPVGAGRELYVTAFLTSSNTRPREISDALMVRSPELVRLRLRPETAGILSVGGLRLAPRTLFAQSDVPPAPGGNWAPPSATSLHRFRKSCTSSSIWKSYRADQPRTASGSPQIFATWKASSNTPDSPLNASHRPGFRS